MTNVIQRALVRNSLHAELSGDDTCTASGITVKASAPVLALCRQLIAAGMDPDTAMEVYRGAVLALRVRSIGEAASLEINSHGTAFVARRERRTAPPMRSGVETGLDCLGTAE